MTALPIPESVLDQHAAILGKTGSGKSYTTRGLVEWLLARNRRVCVLDYTGVWYGLRMDRTGTRRAHDVVIFGGDHADVPLADGAGPILARLIATGNRPAIVDLDGLTVGAQQRFVVAFFEELYRLNSAPLHLIIEEADEFAPQTGAPGAERMIGATCRLFQRGRRKGFRCVAVTQRPANLHKRVLTQCNSMIAMRLPAPQDRKAVAEWIKGHGDEAAAERMMASMARLETGLGWVYAPEKEFLEQVKFPPIATFDSMRAPTADETGEPATWADIDLGDISVQMAAATEQAKANDPAALRKRLAELEAQIAHSAVLPPDALRRHSEDVVNAEKRGYDRGYEEGREHSRTLMDGLRELAADVGKLLTESEKTIPARPVVVVTPAAAKYMPPTRPQTLRVGNGAADKSLGKAERLILTALAQYRDGRTKVQIAVLTGYAVGGGAFNNALGALRSKGYITGAGTGNMMITSDGASALGDYEPLPHGDALLAHWRARLGKAERLILDAVTTAYPRAVDKVTLGTLTNYEPSGGGFNNALGHLRTLELISRGAEIRASDDLFG